MFSEYVSVWWLGSTCILPLGSATWDLRYTERLSFKNFNIVFFGSSAARCAMAEAARLLNAFFVDHDCKALRLYLKKNYDCDARQAEAPHSSLLHHVASLTCTDYDQASMVQTLVKRGVEVDAKDDNSMTPLMHCAGVPVAKALLRAGADVHAVCNQQKTALHWATGSSSSALVALLLQSGASATAVCSAGCLPLHCATKNSGDNIAVSRFCSASL
jgi:ankyrin repeat protein